MSGKSGVDERVQHIVRALERYQSGVHALRRPAYLLDSELPEGLAGVYRAFDGGDLFHETIALVESSALQRVGDVWTVGTAHGHDLRVDPEGRVWLFDPDLEEDVEDGSSFDRWLHGVVEAEGILYASDGEFRDDVAEESGELRLEVELDRLRAQIKRDKRGLGPRWKLARHLREAGEMDRARHLLEEVVDDRPDFAWGWFDLSRISAQLGEWEGARDEAAQAAEVSADLDARAYFLAQAAAFASRSGDDGGRSALAAQVTAADPQFVARNLEGLHAELEAGDEASARQLWTLLRAVAPHHLEVLALKKRLDG